MRVWSFGAAVLACLMSGAAYAETWVGHQIFESGTHRCSTYQTVDYTYTLEGSTFTVTNQNGKMLTTTVPESGDVNKSFKSPSGASLNVSGNVKTKELRITNTDSGCKWKTPPKK